MSYPRETLIAVAFAGAERVRSDFDSPTDDWSPILLWKNDAGLHSSRLDPRFFTTPGGKDQLAVKITKLIRTERAHAVALLLSVWRSEGPARAGSGDAPDLAPADDLNRTEALIVEASDHVGDETWVATIHRHQTTPPTLGDWESLDAVEGRFAAAISAGFRREITPLRSSRSPRD